jgi:hypothetical protein
LGVNQEAAQAGKEKGRNEDARALVYSLALLIEDMGEIKYAGRFPYLGGLEGREAEVYPPRRAVAILAEAGHEGQEQARERDEGDDARLGAELVQVHAGADPKHEGGGNEEGSLAQGEITRRPPQGKRVFRTGRPEGGNAYSGQECHCGEYAAVSALSGAYALGLESRPHRDLTVSSA